MQCPKCDNIVTVIAPEGCRKCLRCLFQWWGPMTFAEAKRIWGDAMSDEDLKEWLEMKNKIKPELHGDVPKGATVEIVSNTGKVVPCDDY